MLQLRSFMLRAALILIPFFYISLVDAAPGRYGLQGRDDTTSTTLSSTVSSSASISSSASQTISESTSGNTAAATSSAVLSSASKSVAATSSSSISISSIEPSTTIPSLSTQTTISGSIETGLFNSTLTPNLLPITPTITPAFGIAGVLLMLTGCIYTFIGIKSKRLHIFLSTSYLTNLAITVLVIYIMNPPISNAIQGAYLAAIVVPGIVIGGAAIVFPDMTEGIGCILGGFCIAMWLLVLKPGGLLTSTTGIAIMVTVFCVVTFATSFSRYTRPYGLIVSLSFAGATAIVLGIDCFSRAGLKEFWAWIWNLNDNLFPLGVTSYPITRGIRVEIAAIFVISLAGMASQMKLWQVIAKKKAERKTKKRQEEEDHEREEQDVGRQIEERSRPERLQWEAVYGDGEKLHAPKQSPRSIADSGVGDMDSPKKTPRSTLTSIHRRSTDEEIQVAEMGMTAVPKISDSVMSLNKQDGSRVAQDDRGEISTIPEFEDDEDQLGHSDRANIDLARSDSDAELSSERKDRPKTKTSSVPEIIPRPFQVANALNSTPDEKRWSVTTYDDQIPTPRRNRFSANNPLKRLSNSAMRKSQRLSGFSLEVPEFDDRRSSVAATIDGISDQDDLESLPADMTATTPLASTAPTDEKKTRPVSMSLIELQRTSFGLEKTSIKKEEDKSRTRSLSLTETVATTILESSNEEMPKSKETVVTAKCPSLTEEVLPSTPSKVVMSYRTNEWAKHLSNAEIPAVETLKLGQPSNQNQNQDNEEEVDGEGQENKEDIDNEIPAPVDVRALQQTAINGMPSPGPRLQSRGNSRSSIGRTQQQHVSKSPSGMSLRQQQQGPPQAHNRIHRVQQRSNSALQQSVQRSGSALSMNAEFNDGNTTHASLGRRSTSTPSLVPLYAHTSSSNGTSSTPNLLSKRQSMVKSKHSFMSLKPLASTPELEAVASGGNTQPSTPGLSSTDSGSFHSRNVDATTPERDGNGNSNYQKEYFEQERELSDNMNLKERKAFMMRQKERESAMRGTPIPFRLTDQLNQPAQRNSGPSRSRSRQSMGQTPAQREAVMASWRASIQEDLQGVNRQRTTSAQGNIGGYGNGYGMGGNSAAAVPTNGRLSAMQEREIDMRREQLFEEKRREGFVAAMRKGEEERRRAERNDFIRGGALDGRSGVEGAHREVMRRLQRKASNV